MKSEILFDTKFVQLKKAKSCGSDWFYAHRANASGVVVIVPVICVTGEVIFLKTKRPPLLAENISKFNIELPAGLVGDIIRGESFLQAAKNELLEETGYQCEKFTVLCENLASSGGLTSEVCTLVLAEIENNKPIATPIDDGGVIVERIKVKIQDIKKQLKTWENEGCSVGAQTLAGLFYL